MRVGPLAVALCLLLRSALAAAQPASAPDRRAVGLLSVEIAGDSSDQLRTLVAVAIEKAIGAAGARFVGREAISSAVTTDPQLEGCLSTQCLARLGTQTGASEFVRAHVSVTGNSYDVDLELLSPRAEGGLSGRVQRTCSVCTVTDLRDQIAAATGDLLAGRTDPAGTPVEITTQPDGAEIVIDDEPRGRAPFRGALPPGPHRVLARLEGHTESIKDIEVPAGRDTQAYEIGLIPAAALGGDRRPYRTWKWVAAGGAATALVTAAVLFAIDGDGSCDGADQMCPDVYDTKAAGLVGLALGLAAGGTSAWMFVRDNGR